MFFHHKKYIIGVTGMHCEACSNRIKNTLEEISEVNSIKVNLKKNEVIINYDNEIDTELIQNKIEKLGYTVTGIKNIN